MIKVNVIIKDKKWLKFLKNPNNYLKNKIKKIQNYKYFKRYWFTKRDCKKKDKWTYS